jgi:hypothetical protein
LGLKSVELLVEVVVINLFVSGDDFADDFTAETRWRPAPTHREFGRGGRVSTAHQVALAGDLDPELRGRQLDEGLATRSTPSSGQLLNTVFG